MQISTILDYIDNGHMALPEFQRGYVWNRDQVRAFMEALYKRYPVGSLLVWATQSEGADHRGEGKLAKGVVKLLLDGQQRITSLYGILRGHPPDFFDGDARAFSDLRFHLAREEFAFYSPVKMRDDPLWIDVTRLMADGMEPVIEELSGRPEVGQYLARLNRLYAIREISFHVDEVTGKDKTIDVVVNIFNQVNSGGTKLSTGDLALAKVCADWPEARGAMRSHLERWQEEDFQFNLDWLLRSVNTVLCGEARFASLHEVGAEEFQGGLQRAVRSTDYLLNLVAGRLGLDHDRVLFGRYAFPVMARLVDVNGGRLDTQEAADRLLFWYLHCALWGRFSGSTETKIKRDLEVLQDSGNDLEALLKELQLWRGGLEVRPDHFGGWSLGARFYPMLYLLTRAGGGRDWGTGLELRHGLLGKGSRLEVHHIFPKSLLYDSDVGYKKSQVNAVANFCFLTQQSNLDISNRWPEQYLPEIAERFPGALESQWIPMDPDLWKLDRYLDFVEARKVLLAAAAQRFLDGLLHGRPLPEVPRGEAPDSVSAATAAPPRPLVPPGGVESEEEERALMELNDWVVSQGLPGGRFLCEIEDPDTAEPIAILDLAWPDGLQEGLSKPVAVLIDEGRETLTAANRAGYRYFQSVEDFREHVLRDVLVVGE